MIDSVNFERWNSVTRVSKVPFLRKKPRDTVHDTINPRLVSSISWNSLALKKYVATQIRDAGDWFHRNSPHIPCILTLLTMIILDDPSARPRERLPSRPVPRQEWKHFVPPFSPILVVFPRLLWKNIASSIFHSRCNELEEIMLRRNWFFPVSFHAWTFLTIAPRFL